MARKSQQLRCKAKRRDGQRCTSWAVHGFTVCRMHGAGGKAKGHPQLTTNLKHGRYAFRLRKNLSAQGAGRLEELSTSPEVLNIQRSAAVSQFLMEQHLNLEPTDDEIEALAKMRLKLDRAPTPAECEAVRLDLLLTIQKAIETHAGIQEKAKRALTSEALLGILVVPIMSELGTQFMKVVARHVTPEVFLVIQQDMTDVRRAVIMKATTQVEAGP